MADTIQLVALRLALCIPVMAVAAPGAPAHPRSFIQPADAQIISSELVELSGIVPAAGERQFWGHNDSGHAPVLFRFDDRGSILQRVELPEARNRDWEAMTTDGRGGLLIGDIGDNARVRGVYTIYHLPEPGLTAKSATPLNTRRFVYPENRSHNSEAMFVMNGGLYVISKETPLIFRIEGFFEGLIGPSGSGAGGGDLDKHQPLRAKEIGRLNIQGLVTDAAWSHRLQQLAVLTYNGVFFYEAKSEDQLSAPPTSNVAGFFGVCEALCYDGSDVVLTNEAGMIWRIAVP